MLPFARSATLMAFPRFQRRRAPMLLLLLVFCGAASAAPSRPTLFVAAGGSDAAKCTKASPCRTFGRAYAVA